ncbi:MAG: isopeptide-forming domain-containing fimbrial protein [Alcanivorax nanhaiticus]
MSQGTYDNLAVADWTSLDGSDPLERIGDNCPVPSDFNDYCAGPATASITSVDTSGFAKTVLADSWDDAYSTAVDSTVRVGDTVTYALTLSLREGQTTGVNISDTLPGDMELVSFSYVNSANITFTPTAEPAPGDSGTLNWALGDISNTPDGVANDDLVIEVEARVLAGGLTQVASTVLNNAATVNYDGASSLSDNVDITVLQPVLSQIIKEDPAGNSYPNSGSALTVDIVNDTMSYVLETCNDPSAAPAYNVQLVDTLEQELDETTISNLQVSVNGAGQAQGSGYNYALIPGGGSADSTMTFDLLVPVEAGQCATVSYDVGFYTSVPPNSSWANNILLNRYDSLPAPAIEGEQYTPLTPAQFWMTNAVVDPAPVKTVVLPVAPDTEVTIGESVSYEITVPAINAARGSLIVTDTLTDELVFDSATVSIAGAAAAPIANTGVGQDLQFDVGDVQAGDDVVVTVTTYVDNSAITNDSVALDNSASYTYTGYAGAALDSAPAETLTIVESLLGLTKDVANLTNPGSPAAGGDVLQYTVTLANSGNATAFDTNVIDTLPAGLTLVASSASAEIGGVAVVGFNPDPTINGNELTWGAGNGDESLDVPAAESLVLTYQVTVGAASGALANSVIADWTSLDTLNPLERIGDNCPAPSDFNDYCVGPVVSTIDTAADIDIIKSVFNVTTGQAGDNASPGDVLEYTITLDNRNSVSLPDFDFQDDPGSWNTDIVFVPGSMAALSVVGSTFNDFTDINGGTNGAGLVDLRNLVLGADGSGSDVVTITFQITLAAVITNGTLVENRSAVTIGGAPVTPFDPAVGIAQTLIMSAPQMQVQKVSADITGDLTVLSPGDTLRYTITVVNIGDENALDVYLRDAIPQYTTYVPNSTTLNGNVVADPAVGISALESGMLINAPGNVTPGAMEADPAAGADATATIGFDVIVDSDALPGTRIVNQGFVAGDGAGGTPILEQPSDDPATAVADDPTVDIVGNLPLLDVQKTVMLDPTSDANNNGAPDPTETLIYTFTVTNTADIPASGVTLQDAIPAGTLYVTGTTVTTLNGTPVPDNGADSALVAGMEVNSPGEAAGVIAANSSAVVTLEVIIDAGTLPGAVIINQGTMTSNELPDELTDQDGVDSNGDQPTEIIVGEAQQLSIAKSVLVVGGGAALPGAELEYTVQVTNEGVVPATQVVIQDDLTWLTGVGTYVAGSARLNGGVAGVTEGAILVGDYGTAYGDLAPGDSAVLRFRILLDDTVLAGTTFTNTGVVNWNNNTQTANSSVTSQVGAIPGTATLSGFLWHDVDFDDVFDATETALVDWEIQAWQNNVLLRSTIAANDGSYSIVGLPETQPGDTYELRFVAPGASASTAPLGYTHSDPAFTDGLQVITGITAAADSLVADLNLPIDPNGVVYNSITREAVAGATLTMVDASGNAVAASCFDSTAQQGQVTLPSGFYKFDLNFSDGSCPSAADYRIQVTPPAGAFTPGESTVIPPLTGEQTAAYDAVVCSADAIVGTAECEAQVSAAAPPASVSAGSPLSGYYLKLMFAGATADDRQIFNNHIPVDPQLSGAVTITKTASIVNVSRGEFVPYVIRINNSFGSDLSDLAIVDSFPAGFKYVKDSARLDDQPVEPDVQGRNLIWRGLDLSASGQHTLKLLFIVGAGVGEGEYINRAQVFQARTTRAKLANADSVSGEAQATVRVVPDPDFDCTDVIGKVYDDANMNGYQDDGEAGLPNVRAVTARGLIVTSDQYGRFHITCAVVPNELRGSNFILKVDDRSLPSGYRLTTENPLVRRATRGKMVKFNFGAALHRVVRLDVADPVFESGTADMRLQWSSRMPLLMEQLVEEQSILRIAYMAETEDEGLVEDRLKAIKKQIARKWTELGNPYELVIETEVFWRTGAPPKGGSK